MVPILEQYISVVNEFVNNDVAVVELLVDIPGVFTDVVSGISKRDPVDKPNSELALKLAYGRAFEKVGQRLLRQANGLVKHADDMREVKDQDKSNSQLGWWWSNALQNTPIPTSTQLKFWK